MENITINFPLILEIILVCFFSYLLYSLGKEIDKLKPLIRDQKFSSLAQYDLLNGKFTDQKNIMRQIVIDFDARLEKIEILQSEKERKWLQK